MGLLRQDDPLRTVTVIPICYSVMTSKCTAAYLEFFQVFKKITPEKFVMERLYVDQEAAILKGLDFCFGNTEVKLCQWHLTRSLTSHYSTFNYLKPKIMKQKFNTLFRLYQSMIHLPLHLDQIRRGVISIIESERQKYKKTTRKLMYADLKAYENYVLSNYLNNTARSPPHLWATKEPTLGNAYHTTAQSESTNRVLRDYIKPSESEVNQIHDLTRVVRRYNKNLLSATLDEHKARKKAKKRVVKSMILCGLFNQAKSLQIYHHDEERCKRDLATLRKVMLVVSNADVLVSTIMKNKIYLDQVYRRHLNDRPEDAQFVSAYTEG